MSSIDRVEASAATRAATGVAYYQFHGAGIWKAIGPDNVEIATHAPAEEAPGKGVLRIDAQGRSIEIDYSIHCHESVAIEGVMNGVAFGVTFAKDGGLLGEEPNNTIDPAIADVLRGISSDLAANRGGSRHAPNPHNRHFCGGLWDAVEGAQHAHHWLSVMLLVSAWRVQCT